LPAITRLKALFTELERMQSLLAKLAEGQTQSLVTKSDTAGELPESESESEPEPLSGFANVLSDLAKTVSQRNGKRTHFSAFGLTLDQLPESLRGPIQSMAVQLVRNSIVHGAMQPQERVLAGKTDYINITASINQADGVYSLLVRDDGEGFDNQAILDRAVELGIIKAEQLDRINLEQAFKLVFQPNFSRLSEANLDGGRGVGLDVVHTMAKELGGKISVQHKHGRFCQFKISIPMSENLVN
jgi:two-component system chemotaxis sensor kinase CheA